MPGDSAVPTLSATASARVDPSQTTQNMKLALALTAGTAAAFVAPSSAPATKTQLAAAPVQEWAGATAPFGFFDPLGLSKDVDAGRLA